MPVFADPSADEYLSLRCHLRCLFLVFFSFRLQAVCFPFLFYTHLRALRSAKDAKIYGPVARALARHSSMLGDTTGMQPCRQ